MSNKKKSPRKIVSILVTPAENGYSVEVNTRRGDNWATGRSATSVFTTSADVALFVEETLDGE